MCERPALAGEALCNGPELELEHRLPTCGSEGSIPSSSTVIRRVAGSGRFAPSTRAADGEPIFARAAKPPGLPVARLVAGGRVRSDRLRSSELCRFGLHNSSSPSGSVQAARSLGARGAPLCASGVTACVANERSPKGKTR